MSNNNFVRKNDDPRPSYGLPDGLGPALLVQGGAVLVVVAAVGSSCVLGATESDFVATVLGLMCCVGVIIIGLVLIVAGLVSGYWPKDSAGRREHR